MVDVEQSKKQRPSVRVIAFAALLAAAMGSAGCSDKASVSTPSSQEMMAVSDVLVQTPSELPEIVVPEMVEEPATSEETAASQEAPQPAEIPAPDITEMFYSDLNHGEKGAAYQKYIVLHDTEGGGSPEGVVSYWEGNGNLVAAHFVIGKDGHIVQCVPLDGIAHHAGWGSGDANARFGITEDGRDDLLGREPSSYYTDYGMNAWSIGIEMVHMGGEGDYPEAQLAALDALIAYIDAYYGGYAGEIIDHKMWREGNSDTSAEFTGYLANYRDHRTHD